jgi:hypothetical protein
VLVIEGEKVFKPFMETFGTGFPSNMFTIVDEDIIRRTLDLENTSRRNCSQCRKQLVHIFAVGICNSSPQVCEVNGGGKYSVVQELPNRIQSCSLIRERRVQQVVILNCRTLEWIFKEGSRDSGERLSLIKSVDKLVQRRRIPANLEGTFNIVDDYIQMCTDVVKEVPEVAREAVGIIDTRKGVKMKFPEDLSNQRY